MPDERDEAVPLPRRKREGNLTLVEQRQREAELGINSEPGAFMGPKPDAPLVRTPPNRSLWGWAMIVCIAAVALSIGLLLLTHHAN